jgi:hypothetical protein
VPDFLLFVLTLLSGAARHVRLYEDQETQRKARSKIPLLRLWKEAEDATAKELSTVSTTSAAAGGAATGAASGAGVVESVASGVEEGPPVAASSTPAVSELQRSAIFREHLLRRLTYWYKHEYFQWVNAPDCSACGGKTQGIGGTAPSAMEQRWGAGRVEVYSCEGCGGITRFPRYNHPAKLLDTHCGRCGEWANAFTLCCIALGFEARHVTDWTDHVWTEVWSERNGKWLHVDPCENAVDQPLMYETGWGKKLSYVVACSPREVVDVSKRYTCSWDDMATRRSDCSEAWLAALVATLDYSQHQGSKAPHATQSDGSTLVERGTGWSYSGFLRGRQRMEIVSMEASSGAVRELGSQEATGRTSGECCRSSLVVFLWGNGW